jgi:hypothetical protein
MGWAVLLALVVVACGRRPPDNREQARDTASRAGSRSPGAERIAALASIPYLNFVPVGPGERGKSGVTAADRGLADRGYVLFVPKPRYEAVLVDVNGDVVHRWASETGRLTDAQASRWPDFFAGWQTASMAQNGDLFAILSRQGVLKVDWNSRLVWSRAIPAHHDIALAANGDIYVLTESVRVVESGGRKRVVLDDGIAILRSDGSIRRRLSLHDVFARSGDWSARLEQRIGERFRALDERGLEGLLGPGGEWRTRYRDRADVERAADLLSSGRVEGDEREAVAMLRAIPGAPSDLFHANTVVPLKRHARGLWEDGDVMVSLANWNLVAVIDMKSERIGWSWGPGEIEGAHQPTVLDNGNVLVFDNGESRNRSKVIEVDPERKSIVWSYEAPGFLSASEGGCERLPSGNVLITDSRTARVFEITRGKQIVWEYFNPLFDGAGVRRSGIYRAHHVPPETAAPLLASR